IGFGTEGFGAPGNTQLPNGNIASGLIAPYWDNLNPGTLGSVCTSMLGEAPNRRFVVSWVGVPKSSTGTRLSFQTVFEEWSDELVFQYLDLGSESGGSTPAGATVGIQDGPGQVAAVLSYNGVPFNLSNG